MLLSDGVVQLCIQPAVHLVDGVHSGRVVHQELPHLGQALLLFHVLAFGKSLQEVGPVGRRVQRHLGREDVAKRRKKKRIVWRNDGLGNQTLVNTKVSTCLNESQSVLDLHRPIRCFAAL